MPVFLPISILLALPSENPPIHYRCAVRSVVAEKLIIINEGFL